MKERKSNWDESYSKMDINEHLFDCNKKSPENFIDDIKMEYLLPQLPKSGVIVEIGAGSGKLLTRIGINRVNTSCRLIGIDYSRYSNVLVRENLSLFNLNGTSVCGDVFHLPLRDNSVDVVISGGLLEHFSEMELNTIIVREMMRILKVGGLFYADIAPKKFSLLRPVILKDVGGYENSLTKEYWRVILFWHGLREINIFSGFVLPPNFYEWFRSGLLLDIVYNLKSIIKSMDNTILSDIFGFEYFVFGRKV